MRDARCLYRSSSDATWASGVRADRLGRRGDVAGAALDLRRLKELGIEL